MLDEILFKVGVLYVVLVQSVAKDSILPASAPRLEHELGHVLRALVVGTIPLALWIVETHGEDYGVRCVRNAHAEQPNVGELKHTDVGCKTARVIVQFDLQDEEDSERKQTHDHQLSHHFLAVAIINRGGWRG